MDNKNTNTAENRQDAVQAYQRKKSRTEDVIDLRYLVDVIWSLKYWIVASVVVAFVIGNLYLRTTTPKYTRSAMVLIANDRQSGGMGSEIQLLSDITGMRANGLIQNEMRIMRSRPLMQKVVEDLNLNVRYFQKGRFRDTELYGEASPLAFELISGNPDVPHPSVSVEIQANEDSVSYTIKGLTYVATAADAKVGKRKEYRDRQFNFGDAVDLPGGSVMVISKTAAAGDLSGKKYTISHISPKRYAKMYASMLSTETTDYTERSSVIELSLTDNIPARADDILNTLIEKYNAESKEFMNGSTRNTLIFIEERLAELEKQLGDIEIEARNYKTENNLVDFIYQSQASITKGTEYEQRLTELGIQLKFMDMIRKYMESQDNSFSLLPADIGISDTGLSSIIGEYNTLVMSRRRMMQNASETNPRVALVTSQIEDMRSAISLSVKQLTDVYNMQYETILKEAREAQSQMSDIPSQQLDVAKIERQQAIVEPLYILLRQKKEEALIAINAQTANARVVEPADGPDSPASPRPMMIYFVCVVIGALLPPGTFFVKELLKRKISSAKDVLARTDVPLLGAVAASKTGTLVSQGGRDLLSETFRAVRANIGFLKGKVFQITSSVSGEGKSTVAVNIALTLSFAGHKVLLIEADLRNGKDYMYFGVKKSAKGLSTYLSGKSELEEVLQKGVGHENLDVILSGAVPPNPNELLAGPTMENLMADMREKYDYIICDSAPYMMISDPVVVNKYTDATIYVVRCGVSDLRFVDEIDAAANMNRLRNLSILVNAVDYSAKAFGTGSFGYGYGYGYGSNRSK